MLRQHLPRVTNYVPMSNGDVAQIILLSLAIAAGLISLMAFVAYFFTKRREEKEANELLLTNDIQKKITRMPIHSR